VIVFYFLVAVVILCEAGSKGWLTVTVTVRNGINNQPDRLGELPTNKTAVVIASNTIRNPAASFIAAAPH
jgi:hypothetical protein